MEENYQQNAIKYAGTKTSNKVISKIFEWMFLGLLVSAITAYVSIQLILSNMIPVNMIYIGMIVEIALVLFLYARLNKMSTTLAIILFLVYASVSGLTLAPMFILYKLGTITNAFVSASVMFGAMAVYGAKSNKDLSNFGAVGMMLLCGIIITTLLNLLIFHSTGVDLLLLYVGLAVFAGLTAYDMQKFKELSAEAELSGSKETMSKVVIMGALQLYLDFINIFIRLVRILGRRRD